LLKYFFEDFAEDFFEELAEDLIIARVSIMHKHGRKAMLVNE